MTPLHNAQVVLEALEAICYGNHTITEADCASEAKKALPAAQALVDTLAGQGSEQAVHLTAEEERIMYEAFERPGSIVFVPNNINPQPTVAAQTSEVSEINEAAFQYAYDEWKRPKSMIPSETGALQGFLKRYLYATRTTKPVSTVAARTYGEMTIGGMQIGGSGDFLTTGGVAPTQRLEIEFRKTKDKNMIDEKAMREAFQQAKINLGMTGSSPFSDLFDEKWFAMFAEGWQAARTTRITEEVPEGVKGEFSKYYHTPNCGGDMRGNADCGCGLTGAIHKLKSYSMGDHQPPTAPGC